MRPVFLAVLFICLFCTPFSRADDSSALINEALDKMVTLEVDGVFPQVMKKITDQTAVPIEVPQHVYDLLPWGEQTSIKATIKGQTLRQALTALTHKLGIDVGGGAANGEAQAPPVPLERPGRRATIGELDSICLARQRRWGKAPRRGSRRRSSGSSTPWIKIG